MEFNDYVKLERRIPQTGYGGTSTVEASACAWGHLEEVSASFRSRLGAGGFSVDRILHMWRTEYASLDPTHVIVGDDTYRIDSVNSSINEMYVKLVLIRSD
jgi:hypothetical protein